ncbi:MAG: hypothetical protein Q8N10_03245 [Phenylobacterium sp.]|uniref:hypothetical protein n=1 Tax=Phenylobacterium sp. TaxID=1871053 RepID=UPI00271D1AA4|nr:hypothetical protein [Phenylobacterium sp.]MDO8912285.1 hypothetical protein [Phenylobacterium sp.]MDP3099497.1 hypothetical protein [Phenylobacterium sp.]
MLAILTSRLAGPISSAFALLFLVLALTQCVGKVHQTRRADAAEMALSVAKTDLDQCQRNEAGLEASMRGQNAAVKRLETEASIRTAAAEEAVTQALRGRAGAEARAAKLLRNPPAGIDACARMESADTAVLRSLQ